jgi:hypothetical protein
VERARTTREKEIAAHALEKGPSLPPVAAPPPKAAPVTPARRKPSAPVRVAKVETLRVKLHARFGGEVTVDGIDRGNRNLFELDLPLGVHNVNVHHACCADLLQAVTVTRNQHDQMYPLRYGAPLPARLKVINAPSDARVLVDGVAVGTASDPRPFTMNGPSQRTTVVIGDRTLTVDLKAGSVNQVDYHQATP